KIVLAPTASLLSKLRSQDSSVDAVRPPPYPGIVAAMACEGGRGAHAADRDADSDFDGADPGERPCGGPGRRPTGQGKRHPGPGGSRQAPQGKPAFSKDQGRFPGGK